MVINYGVKANYSYLMYYGFTFENPKYDCVGLTFHFGPSISNGELKQKLIYVEPYGFKVKKFYADYEYHEHSNNRFMDFCRFYWSDAVPEAVTSVSSD